MVCYRGTALFILFRHIIYWNESIIEHHASLHSLIWCPSVADTQLVLHLGLRPPLARWSSSRSGSM